MRTFPLSLVSLQVTEGPTTRRHASEPQLANEATDFPAKLTTGGSETM